MNTNSENPTDLSGLEIDLLKSFQPSWVKESTPSSKIAQISSRDDNDSRGRSGYDRDDADSRWNRKPPKSDRLTRRPGPETDKSRRPSGDKRPPSKGPAPRRDLRDDGQRRQQESAPRMPLLEGWEIRFLPEPRGIDALDGTLWLNESDAAAHILSTQLDKFYRCESIAVEPPKAASPIIAQCGMSGVLLGPPNLHDYQLKVQKLHAERFGNVAFDIYKARIRMVRDEESIQKWRDSQSSQEVYFPLESPEGTEPEPLKTLAEVAEHFRKNHAAAAIINPGDHFTAPGSAPVNDSAPAVIEFTRRELDNLIRFPLQLANFLSQKLAAGGLQIFKAHENITYVSVARPKMLDRQVNPVSESLAAILDYLESNTGKPRVEQWKALLELPTLPPDPALREPALLRDFHWLLLQGHVVDFASKGLEIPQRPSARPPQDRQEKPPSNRPSRPSPNPKAARPATIVPQAQKPHPEPIAEVSEPVAESSERQPSDPEILPDMPEVLPQVADVLPDAADSLSQFTEILPDEVGPTPEPDAPRAEGIESPAEAGDVLIAEDSTVQETPTLEGGALV